MELATAPVTGAAIGGVLVQRCPDAALATWNRHLATVRPFARSCQPNGLLDIDGDIVLDRRAEQHDQTRSIPLASLERPWEHRCSAGPPVALDQVAEPALAEASG